MELSLDLQLQLEEARKALKKSYAPYSHFQVGAAIKLENGVIVSGGNQENAAYPMCLCAEQTTLAAVSSNYPNIKVNSIAIVAVNKLGVSIPVSPCGACRQVIKERSIRDKSNIRIILGSTANGKVIIFNSIDELLPFGFDDSVL